MNIKKEQSDDLSKIITHVYAEDYVEQKDQEIAALQGKLAEQIDACKGERFWWICGAVILLNPSVIGSDVHTLLVIFAIVIELIFLVHMAKQCGIDDAVVWFDKLLNKVCGSKEKEDSESSGTL